MRIFATSIAAAALLALSACNSATETPGAESGYDIGAQQAKIAEIRMEPDTSYLTEEEREVVNLLIQASDLMSEIYLRQRSPDNPAIREQIAAGGDAGLLDMFDRNFGPWDEIEEKHPFFGDKPMPEGAGFYPADLTREEFDAYLEANPDQKDALLSPYTVVKREGDGFVAVPYSVEYREWLEPAADLLRQAAEKTSNPSLKRFLSLRADAFLSDDYFESELAWMDLSGTPIEIAIGPYEVYTDGLYGTKTAFESFVTLKSPEESAALDKYKAYLRDMEANLPIADEHKNFTRGFESPIVVADQIR